ncbi:unnamed protein product, partial [Symbiodinium sp. KB8]
MSSTFKALYDNCATDVTNNIPSMYQDFYDEFDPFHTSVTGQYNAIQSVFNSMYTDYLLPGNTAVADIDDPNNVITAVAALKSAAQDASSSVSSLRSDIGDLNSEAAPSNADIPDILNTISDSRDAVNAFDFTAVYSAIDTERVKTIDDFEDLLKDVLDFMRFLVEWTKNELGPQLNAIARPALNAAFNTGGLVSMVQTFSRGLDAIIYHLNTHQTMLTLDFNITETTEDIIPRLKAFDDDNYASEGLIFFGLHAAFEEDNADFVMDLEEAKSGTIFKDAAGNTRAGDKMCLSKTCIQNTLDDVFESNMEDIELFDGGGPPVPMSYRTAMFMPYLIPLLIMLFALMPA